MVKGKKHLSSADRAYIEASLRNGTSLTRIADGLGRSTSTIAREISKHTVVAVFDGLYDELGSAPFERLFPIILTDRGTEFSNPSRIEFTETGMRRCHVFFCDPMNSNQKSRLERNHELLREVLPKGTSFDGISRENAAVMMSHINAYIRLSQSDRTPYDVFEFLYGEGIAEKLHIIKIDPRKVCLKPSLLSLEMK